jgi:hypothetical protein
VISQWRKCVHEAAHSSICEKLAGLTLHLSIKPPRCEFFLLGTTAAATDHAHILVCLAGQIAEQEILGSLARCDTGIDDKAEAARRLTNCCHRSGDPRHAARLQSLAVQLVRRHKLAILRLARRLQQ